MTRRTISSTLIASSLIAASLVSGAAHAALEGRDLDGNAATFEAYYDTDLDITWLADANYAKTSGYSHALHGYGSNGGMTWSEATTWAANLSFTDGTHVYDNWRLPTINPVNGTGFNFNYSYDGSTDSAYNITSPNSELAYMFHVNLGNSSAVTNAGMTTGCLVDSGNNCLDNVGPFVNLQSDAHYWSGSEYEPNPTDYALIFDMSDGYQNARAKGAVIYAWAVSPGDVAAVPEAQTYALMLAGLGLIGWRARRRG